MTQFVLAPALPSLLAAFRNQQLAGLPCALFRTPYGEVTSLWRFRRGSEDVDVAVSGSLVGSDRFALDAPVLAGQRSRA